MSKYFLINPEKTTIGKRNIDVLEKERIIKSSKGWETREIQAAKAIEEDCTLKYVDGRVIIKVDMESKNYSSLGSGITIRRERKYNNFNFREVMPSNGIVISAENIPIGAEILIDYTAIHDSNKIFSYKSSSPDVVYYSIKEIDCLAWREGNEDFKPTKDSEFGLRVFKPYVGIIEGIEPTLIKDVLYITTGKLKNQVAHTLKGTDYQIVYQGEDGKEHNLIRFRHSEDENYDREELIGISHELTYKINHGELLVGLTISDCKKVNDE